MRVLIATQHLDIVGGVETYVRALIPLLIDAGSEVALLAGQRGQMGAVLDAGRPIRVWHAQGQSRCAVADEVSGWRPDVVFSQGLVDVKLEEELVSRFPTVLFAHNYFGTCASGTKCHARHTYRECQRVLGPACLAAYMPKGCGGRNPLPLLGMYRRQRRRQALLPRYAAILVASRHMAQEYRRHAVPENRIRVVPLFPTDITTDWQPRSSRRPRSNRVLFVGRLTPLKGIGDLVVAMAMTRSRLKRDLTLVVAGDGPAVTSAREDALRLGILTEFLGWISADRREIEMRSADVLAIPSVWPEPFGLVGLEAGCVGLPAVGYANGGITDWLIPGISGELAPGGRSDPAALAAALCRALADDTHLHRLSVGALQVAQQFDAASHVRSLSQALFRAAGKDSDDQENCSHVPAQYHPSLGAEKTS